MARSNRLSTKYNLAFCSSESYLTEHTKARTPKSGENIFSPLLPKVTIEFLTELQDQLKSKEEKLNEITRANKKLEIELLEISKQLCEKNDEVNRLAEENLRYKSNSNESEFNMNEYWKKEAMRKGEGYKKIQEKMKTQEKEAKIRKNEEFRKIFKEFEDEAKKNKTIIGNLEDQIENLNVLLKEYEKEKEGEKNLVKNCENKVVEIDFEGQLKELELMQKELIKENSGLKEEIEILKKHSDIYDISSFSEDIHRISRQVHTLLSVLQNLKEGKDISLLFLLDLGDARYISSSRQLVLDIAQLKKDINEIKQIASDYHAEIIGGSICSTQ